MRWNMTGTGLSRTGISVHTRSLKFIVFFLFAGFTILSYAAELDCPVGDAVMADLGNGVIMHTCMWEKAANVTVRTGPLELIKNGDSETLHYRAGVIVEP
jgi:hypothetical protein